MKKDLPEKGAILQRDKETYAVKTNMPGGFTTPAELRRIADVAERFNARTIKLTGAHRIALIGLAEDKLDEVREALGELSGGATGLCVRYVKICPGATWCKRAQQVTRDIGLELHERYHRMQLPWKFKIGISGCPNDCSEVFIRDLGLIGTAKGWNLMTGGNGGAQPRIAIRLLEGIPSDKEAIEAVERIIDWFDSSERKCRIGKIIEEMGVEAFRKEVL